jgi:hypothetical protein
MLADEPICNLFASKRMFDVIKDAQAAPDKFNVRIQNIVKTLGSLWPLYCSLFF